MADNALRNKPAIAQDSRNKESQQRIPKARRAYAAVDWFLLGKGRTKSWVALGCPRLSKVSCKAAAISASSGGLS